MKMRLLCTLLTLALYGCEADKTTAPPNSITIISSQTVLAQGGVANLPNTASVSINAGVSDNQTITLSLIDNSELHRIFTETAKPFYDRFTPYTAQLTIMVSRVQPNAAVQVSFNLPAALESNLNSTDMIQPFVLGQDQNPEEQAASAQPIAAVMDQHNHKVLFELTPDSFSATADGNYQATIYLASIEKNGLAQTAGNDCGIELRYPVKYQPSQNFGSRLASNNTLSKHYGIDFPAPAGTPVMAMADGVISTENDFSTLTQGQRHGWGKYIVIRHHDGSRSLYSHLSNNSLLPINSIVTAGAVIGESGNSDGSRRSHLHVEFLPAYGANRVKTDLSSCFVPDTTLAASPRANGFSNPASTIMLDLPQSGTKSTVDFASLPVLSGKHVIISKSDIAWQFQLHNYLIHYAGKYWAMWSYGPGEDKARQHIKFATSDDGLTWSPAKELSPIPEDGYAYIARGFWLRNNELLALGAHFVAPGAFGVNKDLQLHAFSLKASNPAWTFRDIVAYDSINNYAPSLLPNGQWLMVQRDSMFNVSALIGGINSLHDWKKMPIKTQIKGSSFSPDEPMWWALPDGSLSGLFRDNSHSNRLFRSFSTDNGEHWTLPVQTNFPGATSKFFGFRTSKGYWLLISNANPAAGTYGRNEMYLSTSTDGLTFTRMAKLPIPQNTTGKQHSFQYPHAIEQDGHLLIAFSRNKAQIEALKIPMAQIDALALSN